MKITETHTDSNNDEGRDGLKVELLTDLSPKPLKVYFRGGEPEDFSLGRDLNDAWSISDMLTAAYEAGKRGESYEFVKIIEE